MGVQTPLQDPALCAFGYLPRHHISRLYDHFVFNFWRYRFIISPAAVPFYIPETVCKSSSFSLSFPMLVIFCLFFFESSHLNGREIFIFQSMTLTYLYFINVILGPIPAVLFYVFNVLCLFPDSLHPFPIFCWVDWGFLFFFFVLFYFISLKTWKLQRTKLHVLTLLVFGTLEFGDTILLRYNMNM